MKTMLRLIGGLLVPVAFAAACSSSSKSSGGGKPDGSAGATGTGGAAGTGGSTSTSSGGSGAKDAGLQCDTSACTGKTFSFGGQSIPLTPCCMSATQCGVNGGPAGCVSPDSLKIPEGGIPGLKAEKIVRDPKCKSRELALGIGQPANFEGCCAPSGVCGWSNEAFTSIGIPLRCSTPAELSTFLPDAGAAVPCDFPADGGTSSPDAGKHDGG